MSEPKKSSELRKTAEQIVKNKQRESQDLSGENASKLIHELEVHQVELELQNEQLRQAQRSVELSRNRYLELFHQAPVGYATLNDSGFINQANLTLSEMLNLDVADLINNPLANFILPDDRNIFLARFKAFFKQPQGKSIEARMPVHDGGQIHVSLRASRRESPATIFETEKDPLLLVTVTDITKEKEAENKIRFQAEMLDAVGQAVIATDNKGQIIYWGKAAETIYGWEAGEVLGKNITEVTPMDASKKQAEAIMDNLLKGESWSGEFLVKRKDGTSFLAHVYDSPILDKQDRLIGIIGISYDISEERKVQRQLRQANDIIERSPAVAFLWQNKKGWPVEYVSENVNHLFGYSAEDFIRQQISYEKIIHEDDLMRVKAEVGRYSTDPDRARFQHEPYRVITKNGQIKWIEDNTVIRRDDRGNITHYEGIIIDISDRMRARQALQESNRKLNAILESLSDGFFSLNEKMEITYFNRAAEKLLGRKKEEIIEKHIFKEAFPEAKGSVFDEKYTKALNDQTPLTFETYFGKEPYASWYCVNVYPFEDGISVFFQIINKEKELEQQIKYQADLVESVSDAIISTDMKFVIKSWNIAAEKIYGWKSAEVIGKKFSELVESDFSPLPLEQVMKDFTSDGFWQGEVRHRRKDGKQIEILGSVSMLYDTVGKPAGIVSVNRDITEMKQAREQLLREKERAQNYLNMAPVMFIALDVRHKVTLINKKGCQILGYKENEIIGKDWFEHFIAESNREKVKEVFNKIIRGDLAIVEYHENEITTKSGNRRIIAWHNQPLRDDKKKIVGLISSGQDITERKLAERQLNITLRRLNEAERIGSMGYFETDLNSGKSWWSDNEYQIRDLAPDREPGHQTYLEAIHPNDRERVKRLIDESQRLDKREFTAEYRLLRQDGDLSYIQSRYHFEPKDDTGNRMLYGIDQDISVRKMAELEISEARREVDQIFSVTTPICLIGKDYRIQRVNAAFCEYFRVEENQVVDAPCSDILDAVLCRGENCPMQKIIAGAESVDFEREKELSDGSTVSFIVKAQPFKNRDGEIIGIVESFTDITERKKAEQELFKMRWLLEKEDAEKSVEREEYVPFYGDVTELNTERLILDSVGKTMLANLAGEVMDLLDTSLAVYEKNGDYAYGFFVSGWCQFMDAASRKLCGDVDNKEALTCGKWLCHDCCWNESALAAIDSGKPTDIDCTGGIKLYAVPIMVNQEVVGAVNLGYGNPPTDPEKIKELAGEYRVDPDELLRNAQAYRPRPAFIIDVAKRRLHSMARLIAEIIERKMAEDKLEKSRQQLIANLNYFRCMDRITHRLNVSRDFETMITRVVEEMLDIFKSDRVWFANTPDNNSDQIQLKYEVNRPSIKECGKLKKAIPLTPVTKTIMQDVLESKEAVAHYFWHQPFKDNEDIQALNIKSQLAVSLRPAIGNPWFIGLHQCGYERTWTSDEKKLFKDISIRMQQKIESLLLLDQLHHSEERLRRERDFTRLALDVQSDTFMVFEPDTGKAIKWNKTFELISGYTSDDLSKMNIPRDYHSESDLEKINEAIAALNIKEYSHAEVELICKDGRKIPVEYSVSLIRDDAQKPRYVIAIGRDITDRKIAEKKIRAYSENLEKMVDERTKSLEAQTKKLQKSQRALTFLLEDVNQSRHELETANKNLLALNAELESFSYSVSHDLRAPLRGISGFSQLLMEDYKDKLDEKARHYLNRIYSGANKMSALIDDLLQLSRLSRKQLKYEKINLSAIVHTICKELNNYDRERKADFIIEPDIIVQADRQLLHTVLDNLLGNAWKFTAKKKRAVIEFGRHDLDDEKITCFVRDNGAGFDPNYKDKLFVPFQRLHTQDEFSGTGIGLANVQRIIRRHRGDIWAQGKEGEGATFYFRLPLIKG